MSRALEYKCHGTCRVDPPILLKDWKRIHRVSARYLGFSQDLKVREGQF